MPTDNNNQIIVHSTSNNSFNNTSLSENHSLDFRNNAENQTNTSFFSYFKSFGSGLFTGCLEDTKSVIELVKEIALNTQNNEDENVSSVGSTIPDDDFIKE